MTIKWFQIDSNWLNMTTKTATFSFLIIKWNAIDFHMKINCEMCYNWFSYEIQLISNWKSIEIKGGKFSGKLMPSKEIFRQSFAFSNQVSSQGHVSCVRNQLVCLLTYFQPTLHFLRALWQAFAAVKNNINRYRLPWEFTQLGSFKLGKEDQNSGSSGMGFFSFLHQQFSKK